MSNDNQYLNNFLSLHQEPLPCPSITVTPDAKLGNMLIQWEASPDEDVTYRLHRNPGPDGNRTPLGSGAVLIDTKQLSYTDTQVDYGVPYTYTVYAIRDGVFSEPVFETKELQEVTDATPVTISGAEQTSLPDTVAPLPCPSITVIPDTENGVMLVQWSASPDKNVTYSLERNPGLDGEINEDGGDWLLTETDTLHFEDVNVAEGEVYTYSVYAVTNGVRSVAVTKTVPFRADTDSPLIVNMTNATPYIPFSEAEPESDVADSADTKPPRPCPSLTVTPDAERRTMWVEWQPSPDCDTYSLERNPDLDGVIDEDGGIRLLTNANAVFYEDTNVTEGVAYTYTVYAVKSGVLSSPVSKTKVYRKDFSAHIPRHRDPSDEPKTKQVPPLTRRPEHPASDTSEAATALCPLKIAKVETEQFDLNDSQNEPVSYLKFCITVEDPLPENVSFLYFALRTDKDKNTTPTPEELSSGYRVQRIERSQYLRTHRFVYDIKVTDEREFFITLYTGYQVDGREQLSEASSYTVTMTPRITVYWQAQYSLAGNIHLQIDASSDYPFRRIPQLTLCMCPEEDYVDSIDDEDAIPVAIIPETTFDKALTEYSRGFDAELLDTQTNKKFGLIRLKRYLFFLLKSDKKDNTDISFYWKHGFKGKVKVTL